MANPTYTLITSQTLGSSAASVTLSSIPATYTDLKLVVSTRQETGTNFVAQVYFNGVTTNLTEIYATGSGTGSATSASGTQINPTVSANGDTASTFGSFDLYIPNYAGSSNKSLSVDSVSENNGTAAYARILAGLWSSSAAITSITITSASGNLIANSTFYLYGIKNS